MANFLKYEIIKDMNIPILQIPKDIQTFCQNYKNNFTVPQFKHFENFITGVIINDKADIYTLSKGFEQGKHYDSLHHFVSESNWDMEEILKTSISVIKHLPDESKRFCSKGWLIIDDSLIEKFGKMMEAVSKQYDHVEQRFLQYAHCLVALIYADKNGNRYSLKFDLYQTKRDCKKMKIEFRTKIQIAIELVRYAISQGIPFQGVLFDSWYLCKEFVDFLRSEEKDWISVVKSNRNFIHEGKTISFSDYAKTITTQDKREMPLIEIESKNNGKIKKYRYQSLKKSLPSLKEGKETIRILMSYEYDKNNKLKEPIFLVSNRKDWRPEKLFQIYSMRWAVETFFRDAKQHLGLKDYQMRKLNGIKSHWCLVFTSAIILELVNISKKSSANISHLSVNEICQQAFNETLRAIIIWVIDQAKNSVSNNQILTTLGFGTAE